MTIIPRFCLISNITGNIFVKFDVLSVFSVEFTSFPKDGRGWRLLCKYYDCYLGWFWALRLNGMGIIFECLGGKCGGAGPSRRAAKMGRLAPPGGEEKIYRGVEKVEEGTLPWG
jgi:hypothetical protein